jgi:RHS repeat-associated protein
MTRGLTGDGRPFVAEYDAENRMISIQFTDKSGSGRRKEFSYGSDGFLGIEKDYDADGNLTGEQRFIRDGVTMLQVRNGANNVERDHLWGIAKAGGVGALLAIIQEGQTYQYYSNPRGDIIAVLDNAGAPAAAYAYDPFGVSLAATGTLQQPMRFSTKAYDAGTGLYYYGYRFYSPQLGRWLSRDPLSEKGSINLYSFSSNNPITKFDPFGASDYGREPSAVQAELDAAVEALRRERGDKKDSGTTTDNSKKYGEVKEAVEKGLKDKLLEKVCGFLPICVSADKPELTVGKSVGVEVNDVEVVSVGGEVGVGINKTENPTPRGALFTLRLKLEAKVLGKFGKEAEFKTEFGDVSSTPTGQEFNPFFSTHRTNAAGQ